ncbi:hypothetical protein SUDANB180_00261 [Streptomyces sp. enrichment culture]
MSGPAPGVRRRPDDGAGDAGASRPASADAVQRKSGSVTTEDAIVSS